MNTEDITYTGPFSNGVAAVGLTAEAVSVVEGGSPLPPPPPFSSKNAFKALYTNNESDSSV